MRRVCRHVSLCQPQRLSSSSAPHHINRLPRVRFDDKRISILLSSRTSTDSFVLACRALRCKDEIELVAATDSRAWNVALQRRFEKRDERGAAELLGLVANFARENASVPVWTDLLFTVLRQRSSRVFRAEETFTLLDQLKKRYGPQFVARVLVEIINGCANINMMTAGHELLLYHQKMWSEIREKEADLSSNESLIPPSVVGHLLAKLTKKKKYKQAISLATAYFSHPDFDAARDFQQQGFLALFEATSKAQQSSQKIVRTFLDYVEGNVRTIGHELDRIRNLKLEKGFGAAIQCCLAQEEYSLVLHCYSTMKNTRQKLLEHESHSKTNLVDSGNEERESIADTVLLADENIYVNVMKACLASKNNFMLKSVFREMAARGVARSAGFGLAIRYCHEHLESNFLEEVLENVFFAEQELAGAWVLQVENYNDALGCFAATGRAEQAKTLFSRMLSNPILVPDHITMLEMVENYRDAPLEDVYDLMNTFFDWKLAPNLQVFTSLLSICMHQRVNSDAFALIDTMKKRGIVLDTKAFTSIAFIQASRGDVKAIVSVLRDMANNFVPTDNILFNYVINALNESSGIDACFELFRELNKENMVIPEGLYMSMIDLGTQIGLIERTLHVAYNMECEGFRLTSQQWHDLMVQCQLDAELNEFLRIFTMLHHGKQPTTPRFEIKMYKDLILLLTKYNRQHEVVQVQKLAKDAGHGLNV
ncbi:FOG: PPR repeat [Plasmopara halstedii]|uniref:FOG: PPR repeat n=1 Tax=Plasmopara halstedii TaxID=4781 RepID=A0A0P1AR65_PLAHL|nr:FOG: PPR repeat [Plasmopara halstedii]CEG43845.1 FOG: PPR repeat [Plasmopara halstedii]|eukprot:XP_024580214.1 FOG: PPR repeat [Plasmopara halstedii]